MPDLFEIGDASATLPGAQAVALNKVLRGTLGSTADVDVYKFDLVAGQAYVGAVVGSGDNWLTSPNVKLYNSAGTLLSDVSGGLPNLNTLIKTTPLTSGTYYLAVSSASGATQGQYSLSLTTDPKALVDVEMGAGVINSSTAWNAAFGQPVNVSFGFRSTGATYAVPGSDLSGFTVLSAVQQAGVRQALNFYSEISGISFTDVNPNGTTNNATMLFGNYNDANDGSGAFAYFPGDPSPTAAPGDVWLNLAGGIDPNDMSLGNFSFFATLHEIGHAMGLDHPGLYNAAPGVNITYANDAQFTKDSSQYTVMSYFDATETGASYATPLTLMMFDIEAMQNLYGVNNATRTGNTVYGFNTNAGAVFDFNQSVAGGICIWDSAGTDTLDCSGFNMAQLINLAGGTFSNIGGFTSNVSIALRALIENAIGGSGQDTINGNALNNSLTGGAGVDTMTGFAGNDLYYVDSAQDVVVEGANGGTADRVLASVNYVLAANQQIELISTTNSTLTTAINLTGNNLANTILGNNGTNVLNGGLGIDRMTGLSGNDLYFVDNALDATIEGTNGGTLDRVLAEVSYALGLDQQIELFSTTNSLGTTAINLTGNNIANRILGNNGANNINGGLANDYLTGGLGADKFVFNTAIAGGGNVDTISDFAHLTDDIQLAQTIFAGIGATLDAIELRLGTTATAGTDRIIYNGTTGALFYDADGVGGAAQTQFATVTAGTVLDINDFIMI